MDQARETSQQFFGSHGPTHDSRADHQKNWYTPGYRQPPHCAVLNSGALDLFKSRAEEQSIILTDLTR